MSSNLVSLILNSLGENELSAIGNKLGLDPQQTNGAIQKALPMIIGAIARQNTATAPVSDTSGQPVGRSLLAMLDTDGDGNVMDNLLGFFSSGNHDSALGMVEKLFGNTTTSVQQHVSSTSGVSASNASALVGMLIPVVLGALKKQSSAEGKDLSQLLETEHATVSKDSALSGLLGMLDRNNDGSALDDVLSLGAGLLGRK